MMIDVSFFLLGLNVNLGHGGDAGVPDWVPIGAFGFIDFQNGQYWDGISSVAVTDVIASDPDGADFVPGQIVAGQGYVSDSTLDPGGKIIGSLAPAILQGSSVLLEFDLTDDGSIDSTPGGGSVSFVGGDFETILSATIGTQTTFWDIVGNAFLLKPDYAGGAPLLTAGVHKMAVRLTDGNYALVCDGGTVFTSSATISSPAPTLVTLDLGTTGVTLRKMVSYDPADDTALKALTV